MKRTNLACAAALATAAAILPASAEGPADGYSVVNVRVYEGADSLAAGFMCTVDATGGCGQEATVANDIVRTSREPGGVETESPLGTVESGFRGQVFPVSDASGTRMAFDLRLARVVDYVKANAGDTEVVMPKTEVSALSDIVRAEPTATGWTYFGKLDHRHSFTIDLSRP